MTMFITMGNAQGSATSIKQKQLKFQSFLFTPIYRPEEIEFYF